MGPRRAAALIHCGIMTFEDLLGHLPLRYEDRSQMARIADLRPGMKTSVSGRIVVAGIRRARRMTLFEARVEDDSGRLKVLWFNQPYLKDVLRVGKRAVFFGPVEYDSYRRGQLMMSSPQYEIVDDQTAPGVHTGRLVPIYEKLGPLSGKALRRVLTQLASSVPDDLPDPLPPLVRSRLGVQARGPSLREVHVPDPSADLALLNAARSPAHRRLILEELFFFQAGLAHRRRGLRGSRKGISFSIDDRTREAVKRILPFHLTGAQKRVLREIADDMRSPHPMNRLVQGDVGSGKTIVALLAMVIALANGYQAAFMAPTEILAEQHYLTLRRLLTRCPYRVCLLSAAVKGNDRSAALEQLATGQVGIAVGTHALIQEGVRFKQLGLAVVDEQHRFGVLQREDLIRKGYQADVVVMTATPIPRTLALTAYGDLDVSLLDEKPPGRSPVRTIHRTAAARADVLDLTRRALSIGHQVYVVYPLIAESEKLEDVAAATEMAEQWKAALPGIEVGLLHGRLRGEEKEKIMGAFAAGESRVLVATTVVEVGVDVPNATLMIIEHAERFGLAQLHQLRGRVGRGSGASTCVLMSHGRLSAEAQARIDVLLRTDDGFTIAEADLDLRGPGDFFGTRQWGMPRFRAAHLVRDRDLMEQARAEAFRLVDEEATLPGGIEALLVEGEWERRFGLARVG